MLTLLKKMFLTVIIAMVTVSANAQTDTTRAQGWYDFYQAVLADATLPVVYYADGDLLLASRSASDLPVASTGVFILRTATTFPAAAAGRTRVIETTDTILDLLDGHLDGKVTDTEKLRIRQNLEVSRGSANSANRLFGFSETDIRTVRLPATLAAGAVDPSVQAALATAQAEVMRLTTELSNRPTQAQLNAANAARDARPTQAQLATAQAEVARLTTALSNRPTQAQLDAANARVAMLEEQIRAGGGTPVTADGGGGGGSGAGAAVAVAAVGGALYWWKIRNPTATFTFAAMPIDTDAYTAQLNFAPRENWHINVEYTESNLFASHDFVKPETNATAKMTVKYTW